MSIKTVCLLREFYGINLWHNFRTILFTKLQDFVIKPGTNQRFIKIKHFHEVVCKKVYILNDKIKQMNVKYNFLLFLISLETILQNKFLEDMEGPKLRAQRTKGSVPLTTKIVFFYFLYFLCVNFKYIGVAEYNCKDIKRPQKLRKFFSNFVQRCRF